MRIGITYDLKSAPGNGSAHEPDDAYEEFDSPVTIEAIAAVLRGLGHEVELLGDGRELLEKLLADPPELVFNFAEGTGVGRSREARVPAVLEMLGIPYTGSDPFTLAVTLDKDAAKTLAAAAGVPVPRGLVVGADGFPVCPGPVAVGRPQVPLAAEKDPSPIADCPLPTANWQGLDWLRGLQFPLLLKPAWEGSSKGIRRKCLVHRPGELPEVLAALRRDYRQPVLVEEFIDGDEITVGVLGNSPPQVIGVMRVLPVYPTDQFVYSLEVKRDFRRLVRYECPAALSAADTAAVERAALAAYRALGCRDVARIDFRLKDGTPYFLEVNPLPGLNPESSDLVIMMVEQLGWKYERLIEEIVRAALDRLPARSAAGAKGELQVANRDLHTANGIA
jgi:D-alanine-D-alanine ligase